MISFDDHFNYDDAVCKVRERAQKSITEGEFCNISFYRYKNMGFIYAEQIVPDECGAMEKNLTRDLYLHDNNRLLLIFNELIPALKTYPSGDRDRFLIPMINVYYHHIPESDLDSWEYERTTSPKDRIGRIAFVYPDKLPSYVMYHNAIVKEGLLKGDKFAYISLHENILFSYYEEPRNNVNIKGVDKESKVINDWLLADPESHFDRDKGEGSNFLVIPCVFSVDRVDLRKDGNNL